MYWIKTTVITVYEFMQDASPKRAKFYKAVWTTYETTLSRISFWKWIKDEEWERVTATEVDTPEKPNPEYSLQLLTEYLNK